MTRNSKALDSFVEYCESHPQERFWQALRNWSKWNFILGTNTPPRDLVIDYTGRGLVQDTFYLEDLEGTRK